MDQDDRDYLERKFSGLYTRLDDHGNRLTAIETVLKGGIVPKGTCEVIHAATDARVDAVEEGVKSLSGRMWGVVVGVLLALGGAMMAWIKK